MKKNHNLSINGLLAIAVISVLFYHSKILIFDYKIFSGGFIGIDIFFVTLSYLISIKIFRKLKTTKTNNK